jgi:carbon-monoxide dehydrogenase medium subunit
VIPARFRYERPSSLEEALQALAEPDSRALAGGQSLLPAMKLRLARPDLLVDLGGLDLGGIERDDGEVRLGALVTWDELARSDELAAPGLEALPECAATVGDLQVRNRGTVGGGLAHGDPASDLPAVALALGMRLKVRSALGERMLEAGDLFLGPFTTALEPGELITDVHVPAHGQGSGSAYVSFEHPASGFAVAGAAALVRSGGVATVALTGIAGNPFLLDTGREPEGALADVEITGDRYAPADYRRELAAVAVRRAVELARRRAEEAA